MDSTISCEQQETDPDSLFEFNDESFLNTEDPEAITCSTTRVI